MDEDSEARVGAKDDKDETKIDQSRTDAINSLPVKPKGILRTSQNHLDAHPKSATFDEQNVLET